MSKNNKPDLRAWLGFAKPFNYAAAPWLGPIVSGVMVTVVGGLFLLAIASAAKMLVLAVFGAPILSTGRSLSIGGVTVALIGAPFVVWRSIVAQKTLNVTEQGHITDRINKAVEGLGAEKTVKRDGDERTEPNLEVRIGAIYALERLSQDSERDHIQIMEILCAYIRQNAQAQDVALPKDKATPEKWRAWAIRGREHPRLDVDVALKVIERRDETRKQHETDKGYRLGFERAPLRKIILTGRDLTGADLRDAQLQGADLRAATLQGADLWGAQLQGADLWDAQLQGATLGGAELQGADLWDAQLQGAVLRAATLQGATLGGAELQGADLGFATFDGDTNLTAATLRGAAVRFVDFTEIAKIEPHLEGMFGDGTVILPGGHGPKHESWPKHWPKFELGYKQFDKEWKKWLADPEGYVPPEPPEEDAQG
ncbi:Pentapeptide repeat-containing protein [Roseovarius lutimaris]|uniref:Pentapeptide repeat-containing protein n=1 Tax=Roseovarius lutimaris TaxID=1005928 RepID=A0A1I4Y967_9RHOB|nr:pentapeptide repeat-containing protein [Roseovarius lutimaris]SFN34594.1 Pentapeptide repeat-containing protein [Roseovarius lutimaris]